MHEITEENSMVYYCKGCRKTVQPLELRAQVTAMCMVKACTFCGEVKIVNVYSFSAVFIPLDESGAAKVTYVEREGV